MKKVLAICACVLIVCGLGVGAYFMFRADNNPAGTVAVSINPSIEFVINKDGKVLSANATNNDGTGLLAQVTFEGKSIEEAVEIMTDLSTKAGKININATSDNAGEVSIEVNALVDFNTEEIENKIINRVNNYFIESGIYGYAKKVETVTQTLYNDLIEKYSVTKEKAKAMYLAKKKDFSLAYSDLKNMSEQEIANKVSDAYAKFSELAGDQIQEGLSSLETTLSETLSLFEGASELIAEYEQQLKNSKLPEIQRDIILQMLNTAKQTLETYKNSIQTSISQFINNAKEEASEIILNANTAFNAALQTTKDSYELHKNTFKALTEELKLARQEAIKEMQETKAVA